MSFNITLNMNSEWNARHPMQFPFRLFCLAEGYDYNIEVYASLKGSSWFSSRSYNDVS